ncbi:hypothetical protein Dimus_032067, partial [Dionaea muscipula]
RSFTQTKTITTEDNNPSPLPVIADHPQPITILLRSSPRNQTITTEDTPSPPTASPHRSPPVVFTPPLPSSSPAALTCSISRLLHHKGIDKKKR